MKSLQNKIVDRWRQKNLDLLDTSKMHTMADEAVNVMHKTEPDYKLSWWVTVFIVIISTLVSWLLIYITVNPQWNDLQ